jgi:glucose 1-dehydrogenase
VRRRLEGSTALVTGSTRGLGRTIADWLAREGASLVVTGRDVAAVDATVAEFRSSHCDALGVVADLSRVDDMHRLAEETLAHVEHLDILVNNAGMSRRAPFWDVSDMDWEYQVNVNYRAPFILSQHLARHLRATGRPGRIVNVSTIGAHGCHRDRAVYDSAKGGIEVLTRNMAFELAPHGVRVNCVIPGAIPERPGTQFKAEDSRAARYVPVGRAGRADDIAAAVLFFCLPESDFTTGQSLLVDGGHHSYLPEAA